MMMDWIIQHERDILALVPHTIVIDGKDIVVTYIVYPSLIDGKMRKAVLTAALEESVKMGYSFKSYGSRTKLNYRTCWVRKSTKRTYSRL